MLAVTLSDTISLSSLILALLVAGAGLVSLGYGARWKGNAQVAEATVKTLQEALDVERDRADRLETALREALAREAEHTARIAELEALPNLAKILQTLGEQSVREDAAAERRLELAIRTMHQEFQASEGRHQERHIAQMKVLEQMVVTLKRR